MNYSRFTDLLTLIQEEELATRASAQKEYARDESNVFANFDRLASALGLSREQILTVYAYKH